MVDLGAGVRRTEVILREVREAMMTWDVLDPGGEAITEWPLMVRRQQATGVDLPADLRRID